MALIGSSYCSEMFLAAAMFRTPECVGLGVVVLLGRLTHLPAAAFLFYASFGVGAGPTYSLGQFLHADLVYANAKIFGAACLLGMTDVTAVARQLPWLSSPFCRKCDYPTAFVFLLCMATKLVQSVITVSCQICYFALVNAAITADTPQAQKSMGFLVLNLTTALLLVVINAFEFYVKRSVLISGALSTSPDKGSSTPDTSVQSVTAQDGPSIIKRVRLLLTRDSSSQRDSIPAAVPEAVSQPGINNPLHHEADASHTVEMAERLKVLEEQNQKMQEMNLKLMENVQELLERSKK